MNDILDTRFEGKEIEIKDNLVEVGDDINIMEKDPSLNKLLVGVGWDVNAFDADTLDMDISVLLLDKNDQTRIDEDFIYYNNMEVLEGAVKHNGDSRTGAGDGDDETITIDLHGIPFDIFKIMFVLSIYKGMEKDQTMSMVRNAYLRLTNIETRHEILRFDLKEILENKLETALLVGSLNREGPKWHFTPTGEFITGDLRAVCERYGLIIGQY